MEAEKHIYVADDEENICAALKSFLEAEGYKVTTFLSGDALLARFLQSPCDLVILDVMMPGLDGFSVCARIREISTAPILLLTARDSDADYATGINLGGDDYFTKPFSAAMLVMRVKAIFRRIDYDRRAGETGGAALAYGGITINQKTKMVSFQGAPLELTPNEYSLLAYLIEHQDRAISRDELLNRIWGYQSAVETRAADDTVRRLRRKIAGTDVSVDTVWGFGFRLQKKEGSPGA
jgi:DNA-binding response OmpR family regulator